MAVNVKLGVDMSAFKSGIQEANAQLKTFDAQLKFAETTFKKTGNAEAAMATKTDALSNKLKVQKQVVQQYEKALQDMKNAGVDPASKSYQQMAAAMLNMQSAANETEIALNGLSTSQVQAATTADKLAQSVNGIGKKISLDQVISGIDKITGALENAAQKAIKLGEEIWNNVMDSARLSDDILTQATVLDMTPEMYQKYKGVFDTIGEITVTEWAAAKRKIEKAMTGPSSEQLDIFRALGFTQIIGGKNENQEVLRLADNWEDAFWQIGEEIQRRVSTGKLSTEMADVYGEAIFGKKYSSLKNLLKGGKEAFLDALTDQNTISDEALEKNAKLNDTVIKLQESFDALKAEVVSGLAPALTEAAGAIDTLLGEVLKYLQTEEGKAMMDSLGTSLKELFAGLKDINPQEVAQKLVDVLNSITGGLKWLIDHKEDVFHALEWIVGGWATLKLTGGALDILKVINGAKGLVAGSGGTEASTAATSAASSGTGFWASLGNKAAVGVMVYPTIKKLLEEGIPTTKVSDVGKTALDIIGGEGTGDLLDKVKPVTKVTVQEAVYKELGIGGGGDSGGHGLGVEVPVEPVAPEDSAEQIADQVGTVTVPVALDWRPSYMQGYQQQAPGLGGHANGLPFVPYDGYLALLHRGERVMTASQNKSYTYNNNTYFGSVSLNNGLEIDALTESIARNNRRKSSGYGS